MKKNFFKIIWIIILVIFITGCSYYDTMPIDKYENSAN